MQQGTDEWKAARAGMVTASRIDAVMAKGAKGAPSKTRATYMGQLIAEQMTGVPHDSYTSAAMEHGVETEAEARAAYALIRDAVQEVGFIAHPTITRSGASPDGTVGEDGLVEFKCPNTATHIANLRGAKVDRGYRLQMQWQMACTGRKWCDFVSYDPRMPAELSIKIQRVERDDVEIAEIEEAVAAFIEEMDDTITDLTALAA